MLRAFESPIMWNQIGDEDGREGGKGSEIGERSQVRG